MFLNEDEWDYMNSAHPHLDANQGVPALLLSEVEHGAGEYGYCTEFLIRVTDGTSETVEEKIRHRMVEHGDSLLVVATEDLVKVHVHTQHPGAVLEDALLYGSLTRIKIDNMTEQNRAISDAGQTLSHTEQPKALDRQNRKPCGLVAAVAGDGLIEIFRSIGADGIVAGGQSMNPSTEEILAAVHDVYAEHVFLLPNNSNIILAAEQAITVSQGRLSVIPTKSIGAGLGAALVFSPDATVEENLSTMKAAADHVTDGAVTVAIRDTQFGEHAVAVGDYVGILKGDIAFVRLDRRSVLSDLMERMCENGAEICTVFCNDRTLLKEAQEVADTLQQRYRDTEFEIQYGGQPVYDYLLAAE